MEFAYSLEEWMQDWAATLKASLTTPTESADEHLEKLFRSRYTNPVEALWKRARVAAAFRYIADNMESLENAGWILRSSKSADIFPHLSVALYRAFTIPSAAVLSCPPPVAVIIAAAEEQRRLNGP
jgi:hypothetical protein